MLPRMRSSTFLLALLLACGPSGGDDGGEDTSGGENPDGEDDLFSDDWGDAEPTVVSHEGAADALGVTGPDTPWDEMSDDEKEWYMIGKVLPIMKDSFVGHDGERWTHETFGCETCHGENGRERDWEMPSENIYRIPEPNTPAWQNMERIFPEMVTYMREEVTPTMTTLMGEEVTCRTCHPSAG